jgi:hypothetical protein
MSLDINADVTANFRCSRSGYGSQQNDSIGETVSNILAKVLCV